MHAVSYVLDQVNGLGASESRHDNVFWRGAAPRISVCVPTFRRDVSPLLSALSNCAASGLIEIVVYDDGSRDHALLASLQAAAGQTRAAVRIVSANANCGRSAACNAAIAHARADWVLLLDADMQPDTTRFVEAYLDAIDRTDQPALIVGGCALASAPNDRAGTLHRWQARVSECAPSRVRRRCPGRYVFSSNVLAHRTVLQACRFDEGFAGWGWEDVDWGLRVQQRFAVVHIDNPAIRLDLDSADGLMRKYARAGDNLARMLVRHPQQVSAMPLYRLAKRWRALPFRKAFKALAARVARSESLPLVLRGPALKAWQALVHAEAL